ncbi:major facilitator superfamily permease [Streptomyces hygroscopicus subsp. jinggangensis 5008]|nr:major facilitator superfamily permease [Streptomyces hygroscopicus subsp. jinggangensis 5008]AGF60594.1 major facilitator superfamily permease [Streptomyces hygroscopicus subsp. jinggangensis TL01]
MSIAAGVSVANIYYVQPLLRPLATSFAVSDALAGLLPMITMVGYAAGLLLVVPVLERAGLHRLMRWLNAGRLIALALAASATGYPVFAAASVLLGATSVLAQILMPAAASLVPPEAVGRTTARITAGLFGGIVGARVIAGALDGLLGWRPVYALSALATLVVHLALRRLPEPPLRHALGYRALLRSLLPLLRSERGLRRAALTAAAGFAAFNIFWTAVTLYVTGPTHGWSTTGAGLLGLVGVVGTATVLATGRFLDRGAQRGLAVTAAGVMALGLLIAGLWGLSAGALILGALLLDSGARVSNVANQTHALRQRPEARARLNTLYMTTYFAAGSVGSAAGALLFAHIGWTLTTLAAAALAALGATLAARA